MFPSSTSLEVCNVGVTPTLTCRWRCIPWKEWVPVYACVLRKSSSGSACYVTGICIRLRVAAADSSEVRRARLHKPFPPKRMQAYSGSAHGDNSLDANGMSKWFQGDALLEALIVWRFDGLIPCLPLSCVVYWMMWPVYCNSRLLTRMGIVKPNGLMAAIKIPLGWECYCFHINLSMKFAWTNPPVSRCL